MPPLGIIPTYITKPHHATLLATTVSTLRDTAKSLPVMIIDDGSPDSEIKSYCFNKIREEYNNIDIIEKLKNEGFSSTVNIGLRAAMEQGIDAILINADIEFKQSNWLENMQSKDAGIIGALLLYPNSLIQHAGIYFSVISRSFDHIYQSSPHNLKYAHKDRECPVTGALQYIRNEVLQDVGIYDEEFKLGFEDVDYNIRAIRKGYKSLYTPDVIAIHHESAFRKDSSKKHAEWQLESFFRLVKKYQDIDFLNIAPVLMEVDN